MSSGWSGVDSMDSRWSVWSPPGMHLESTWNASGVHLECIWSPPGMHLESTWNASGVQVEFGKYLAGLPAKENPHGLHLESMGEGKVLLVSLLC